MKEVDCLCMQWPKSIYLFNLYAVMLGHIGAKKNYAMKDGDDTK